MPRRRVVTRTVTEHTYTVLVADLETETTFKRDFNLGPKPRTEKGVLKAAASELGDRYRPLKVMSVNDERVQFRMDECEFLKLAEKVLPKAGEETGPEAQ